MTNMQKDAMAYSAANGFIKELKLYKDMLTPQQIRTLKGQALAGNIMDARKGLKRIMEAGR